ncbi:repetitive organellar protein isoform X1 [Tachysurus vachellii]|uniref:repetitive organellar protein isoform X1 n=1 Tax=Tachysurus vachellii TaxID=175792 RepID=UPI00296A93D8|nr:repetitive organellar protein isoform X1 [Tachysurus vachellii]
MAAKENPCRKFQANIFNKSKCQNCFKPRESHLLTDDDYTQANPIYGGWLLLAPEGTNFDNPLHRSRKWQRRFFLLYEHGLLRYALDEMASTLPQGTINLNVCVDVVDAEGTTGQKHSLCICTPDREHYIRAENREVINGWQEALIIFPRTNKQNQKKKRKVEPPTPQEPGPAKVTVTSSSVLCVNNSVVQSDGAEPVRDSERVIAGRKPRVESGYFSLEKPKPEQPQQEQISSSSSSPSSRLRYSTSEPALCPSLSLHNTHTSPDTHTTHSDFTDIPTVSQSVDDPHTHSLPTTNTVRSPSPHTSANTHTLASSLSSSQSSLDSGSSPERQSHVARVGGATPSEAGGINARPGRSGRSYAVLADVPRARRLSHREAFRSDRKRQELRARTRSPGREEVERLFGQQRKRTQVIERFETQQSTDTLEHMDTTELSTSSSQSTNQRTGRSERRLPTQKQDLSLDAGTSGTVTDFSGKMSVYRRAKSLDRRITESSMTPDLLNFKKGWMTKLYEDGLWKKHWFVLTEQSLRYYRDSIAEEAADLDGEIELSSCYDVTEFPVQRNYGFQIHSKEGVFTLSAMTSGIRRNWIQAIMKSVRPTITPDVTRSVPDQHTNTKTAPPTPNISRPSYVCGQSSCDVIVDSAEHRKPRPRDHRQEGRSKTFDWAEFQNERAEALDTSSSPSLSSVSSSASSPSSSVSEGKLLHREQQTAPENKKGHVAVTSAVPSVNKNPDVQMEIEERWHQVETTPLREEKQVPITGRSASFTTGDKVPAELMPLLDTENQKELVRLQEQNTLLQGQLHDAEQNAREGYVLQCTSEPGQPSSDSTSSSTSHRVPWQRISKLNKELKTELEAQRRKHDLANQQVNSLRRSYSEAQDLIGHHEVEIEALQAKLVSAMAEIVASEQAVARMRSELKLEQSRCHEREEEWISNEKTLRAQLRDSEERLRDVEASLLEKTQALRLLERQQALQRDQHKEVQKLQEKLNEVTRCLIATEEAQALREEREKKEHRCLEEKHERERQGLSRRIAESEEKRLKAEEQLQEAQDQVETLLRCGAGDRVESEVREEMLRLQQVLNEQADVIENLRESVRRLEDERDHLTCRCQELVNQIAEADREVGKLQAQLKTEETDYYSLESSYERVSQEFARITSVLQEKEEEVRQTKERYEKLMRQKDQDMNEALVKMAALGSSLEDTEQRLKAKDELLSQIGPREVEQELQVKLVVAEDRISELEEHLNALRLGYANLRMERCGSQEDVLDALEKQADHDISFSTTSSLTLARSSSETEVSFAKRQRIRFSNIQCQKYHQSQRIERIHPDNTYLDFTQGEHQDLVTETSLNLTDDTIQDLSQDISLVTDNTFQYCSDTEKFLSIIHGLESRLQATEEKLRDITSKKQNEDGQLGNKGLMEVCCDDTPAEPDQYEPDVKFYSCLGDIVQDSINNEDYRKALAFVESCRVRVRGILNSQHEEGIAQAQVLTLAEIEKDLVNASLHIRQVAARYKESLTCQSDAKTQMDKSEVKVLARMLAFEGTVLEKMAFSLQDPKSELMQSLSEINKESQQVTMNHQDCLSVIYTDILMRKLKLQNILINELKHELHQANTFSTDNLQTPDNSVFAQNTIHNACINAELAYCLQNLKHSYQDKFAELQRDLVKVKEILQQRDIAMSEAAMPLNTNNVAQDVGDKMNTVTENTLSDINPPELAPYAQQIEREEAHTLAQEIIERHLAGIMCLCVTESVASLDTRQESLITELKGQAKVLYHLSEQLEKACEEDNSSVLCGLPGQIQAVLGPRDTSMYKTLSMHEALIQVQVAYVACRLRAEHERELSLCQETSHNMATLVQEHAQHVAAIHQRFQSSLEDERIHYFKTINSIQEENETLREEAAKQLKEMGRQQEQIVQMEEAFQREIQEMKRMHAEEFGRAKQDRATSEQALIEHAENTQQKLEKLLQEVEGAELMHNEHICKLEHELRGKVQELENVHQEEIQKLHDRYSQTIRTLGERLETIADDTHRPSTAEALVEGHFEEGKGHEQEVSTDSMSLLRSRVQELELQMMNMRDELENKPPDGDMASLREKYQKDFDSLKETCERGFTAMEETHQKVIEDLQRQHQREINKLLEERERLLEEETNATIAAIEAMKNAHREELEKTQRAQLSGVNADIEQLRMQYEEDLQSIHRELEVLSEQYSQKCLENTHLAQALEAERQALQQCQRENQQLHTHNQELNNRLTVEISRMRSCYSGEKTPSPLTQGKDLYELEVLLRIKDSEIQYLKQEINSLKDELQSALRDKKYASDKYKDIYTELSIVRAKADCDISKLREKLAATEALGERDTPTHTPGYDIMKSKSNPDFLKKERSAVSRQIRGVRSKSVSEEMPLDSCPCPFSDIESERGINSARTDEAV